MAKKETKQDDGPWVKVYAIYTDTISGDEPKPVLESVLAKKGKSYWTLKTRERAWGYRTRAYDHEVWLTPSQALGGYAASMECVAEEHERRAREARALAKTALRLGGK